MQTGQDEEDAYRDDVDDEEAEEDEEDSEQNDSDYVSDVSNASPQECYVSSRLVDACAERTASKPNVTLEAGHTALQGRIASWSRGSASSSRTFKIVTPRSRG